MDYLPLRSDRHTISARSPPFCCIFPSLHDRLGLINVPENLMPGLRSAIQSAWSDGIQSEGSNETRACYEIKLRGDPWWMKSSKRAESCRLAASIMRFMLSHGWALELSTHTQIIISQDSWFFRKKPLETNAVMCGILFDSQDMIRVVDGAPEVIQAVRSTIENHWYKGLQMHRVHDGADEFKLKGYPWQNSKDNARASAIVMYLADALKSEGWSLYASVGISSRGAPEHYTEMKTWILKTSKP